MGKEQYSQNNLRWPAAATARTSAQLFNPHTSRAWVPLISCSASAHLMPGCSTPTHLVLGFRSSRARLRLISCPAAQPPHISCSASAHLVPGCSAPTHLVLSFGSSRARLRLISCPAAQPRSNNERLELCNSLSDEGDYSQPAIKDSVYMDKTYRMVMAYDARYTYWRTRMIIW
jgi:hypothetical protein